VPGGVAGGGAAGSVHGYLVIYSVTDRSSFRYAQSCLQELRPAKRLNAVILVANKADVVRNRLVSTAGRSRARENKTRMRVIAASPSAELTVRGSIVHSRTHHPVELCMENM